MEKSLYSEEDWIFFLNKVISNHKLKKYPQLDPYFNFVDRHNEIRELVLDPTMQSIATFSFLPFIKILTKTPRYKYQEDEMYYGLETKIRPISFAAHFDSYIYSFYSHVLTEQYQKYIRLKEFDQCILAYRNDLDGKCNIQFAKEVFENVRDTFYKNDACEAIALDIKGYFDNIDHLILKEKWIKVIDQKELPIDQYKIFRSLTKYSYIVKDNLLKHFKIDINKTTRHWDSLLDLIPNDLAGPSLKEKLNLIRKRRLLVTNLPKKTSNGEFENRGIPQGSPMSAVLSNIYLIDFDEMLCKLSRDMSFTYRRYCDDLIIICHPDITSQIVEIINKEIQNYKLTIQDKKTDIVQFKLDFIGRLRGFNKKKLLKNKLELNSSNEQRFYKNLQYLGFEFNGEKIYIKPGSLSRYFLKMKRRIIKTIVMSYSDNSTRDKIFKKQIFDRYSHIGKRNFLSYAINASKKTYYSKSAGKYREGMDSKSIRRQISAHFSILEQEISDKSLTRFNYKKLIHNKKKTAGRRSKEKVLKK